jgi:4-aminobutyrate aminotransferase-like enzyme
MPREDCAATVAELIQGPGGFIVPPVEFLQGLERICRENEIYLMVDEVQTSFAKTGATLACEYFGITPDILCLSKAIAGGLPMGATATRAELLEWDLNTHENTLGGNPVVVSAALAVLDVCQTENLPAAATRIGDRIHSALRAMQTQYSIIGDVRAVGAMIGIELVLDRNTKAPAVDKRNDFVERCFQKGLLTLGAGASSIRLTPPLILTDDEVDIGPSIIEEVLSNL